MKPGRQIMNEIATIIVEVGAPHNVFCVKISQEDKWGS
jgi:hypothetical protein